MKGHTWARSTGMGGAALESFRISRSTDGVDIQAHESFLKISGICLRLTIQEGDERKILDCLCAGKIIAIKRLQAHLAEIEAQFFAEEEKAAE